MSKEIYIVCHNSYGLDRVIREESYVRAESPEEAREIYNTIAKTRKEYPHGWNILTERDGGIYKMELLNDLL